MSNKTPIKTTVMVPKPGAMCPECHEDLEKSFLVGDMEKYDIWNVVLYRCGTCKYRYWE